MLIGPFGQAVINLDTFAARLTVVASIRFLIDELEEYERLCDELLESDGWEAASSHQDIVQSIESDLLGRETFILDWVAQA